MSEFQREAESSIVLRAISRALRDDSRRVIEMNDLDRQNERGSRGVPVVAPSMACFTLACNVSFPSMSVQRPVKGEA
jgi:hypothetical protein